MLKMSNEYLLSKIEVLAKLITSLEVRIEAMDEQNHLHKKKINTHLADIAFYKSQLKKFQSQLTN